MKLYSLILALTVALTMTACGNGSTTTNETNDSEVTVTDTTINESAEVDSCLEVEDTTLN